MTARPMAYVISPSGFLTVVDRTTNAVVTTIKVGALADSVAVSPDGSAVYVADAAGRLDVVATATGKVTAVVRVGRVPDAVAVSPSASTWPEPRHGRCS